MAHPGPGPGEGSTATGSTAAGSTAEGSTAERSTAERSAGEGSTAVGSTAERSAGDDDDAGKDDARDELPREWFEGPLGATLANLSHELRSPLHGILGYALLLSRDRSLSEKAQQRVRAIERSGRHMLGLVSSFLEASVAHDGGMPVQVSPAATQSLVQDVISLFENDARARGLELGYRIASDVPSHILADHYKIRQILINLVGNAVKYTRQGSVHVLVQAKNLHDDDCVLQIEVMDTGPGIPTDELPVLFKRYARGATGGQAEGAGLGLAISKHNARLLGGTLSVESRVGRGSVFRLVVPTTWLHYDESIPFSDDFSSGVPSSEAPRASGTFQVTDLPGTLRLSVAWVEQMLGAARAGDVEKLSEHLGELLAELPSEARDEPFIRHLEELIRYYDYDRLIEVLKSLPRALSDDQESCLQKS